jgi:hypothetical protein
MNKTVKINCCNLQFVTVQYLEVQNVITNDNVFTAFI